MVGLDTLRSPRFALALIVLLVIISVLGTIVPQEPSTEGEMAITGSLGFNVFYSWPFYFVLLILFASIISCMLPRLLRVIQSPTSGDHIPMDEDLAPVSDALLRHRYRVTPIERGLYAERNRVGALAGPLFHLLLGLIILTVILSGLSRSEGVIEVVEGMTIDIGPECYRYYEAGPLSGNPEEFTIKLVEFFPDYVEDGVSKGIGSGIAIYDGYFVDEDVVYVNHPVSYEGASINKGVFGYAPLFTLHAPSGAQVSSSHIRLYRGGDYQYTASFDIASTGLIAEARYNPYTTDAEFADVIPEDPLLYLTVLQGEEVMFDGPVHVGESIPIGGMSLEFSDMTYWSSLVIVRDPALWFLYIETAGALITLSMSLLMPRRRIWVLRDKDGLNIKTRVDRFKSLFEDELSAIEEEIRGIT